MKTNKTKTKAKAPAAKKAPAKAAKPKAKKVKLPCAECAGTGLKSQTELCPSCGGSPLK